jgi:hypothetical protein
MYDTGDVGWSVCSYSSGTVVLVSCCSDTVLVLGTVYNTVFI